MVATPLPLYRRALGEAAWAALPPPIQRMHDVHATMTASGLAVVERGSGLVARLIAAVMGLPRAGRDVPVRVRFSPDERGEHWERSFAGRRFASYQYRTDKTDGGLVLERFGPIVIELRLAAVQGRLDITPSGWSFLGLPLPRALAPIGETYEAVDADGRFTFHVEIAHAWLGLIVRYRGTLLPDA